MDGRDVNKREFVTHHGLFKFMNMPFGLENAPVTFQRAVDDILASVKWQCAKVCIDDVIIFSKPPKEHVKHIEEVLGQLMAARMTLKL